MQSAPDSPRFTVAEALEALEQRQGDWMDHPDVVAIGVGLDSKTREKTFFMTVEKPEAKTRLEHTFPDNQVDGLPLCVEIDTLVFASSPSPSPINAALFPPRPPFWARAARYVRGLSSLLAP